MSEVPRPPPKVTDSVKARKESPLAQFSEKIGKTQIIEKETKSGSSGTGSGLISHGFFCETCRASFTSSDAYLDHCNGRVHQKNLGLSLKVERVDEVDRVKARLQQLTQKRQATEQVIESRSTSLFERQLEDATTEHERIKEERKLRKKQKKTNSKIENTEADSKVDENEKEVDPEAVHPEMDMLAVMGFNSFT